MESTKRDSEDTKIEQEGQIERFIQTYLIISGFLFTYTHNLATQAINILPKNQTLTQNTTLQDYLATSPSVFKSLIVNGDEAFLSFLFSILLYTIALRLKIRENDNLKKSIINSLINLFGFYLAAFMTSISFTLLLINSLYLQTIINGGKFSSITCLLGIALIILIFFTLIPEKILIKQAKKLRSCIRNLPSRVKKLRTDIFGYDISSLSSN